MGPLITIGIASYNYGDYILKGLNAIKKQEFTDYEILISDDFSSDNSVAVIKKYIKNNPDMNIRLLESSQNNGLISNKNRIIENCSGEYLMLCDADDWMSEDCLLKIAEVIKKEDPDRIFVEVAHVDERGEIIQIEHLSDNQSKWGWNIHHGCVTRTSILKEHNIKIQQDVIDDVYFTIEVSKYCVKISKILEVLYYWLVHKDSEGRKKRDSVSYKKIQQMICNSLYYIGDSIHYIDVHTDFYTFRDKEELRLVLLKIYYFNILFTAQQRSLKDKWNNYKILHGVILEIDRNYLYNYFLSFKGIQPLRKYTLYAIIICSYIERAHLMNLALIIFHVMSKFKYFDQ